MYPLTSFSKCGVETCLALRGSSGKTAEHMDFGILMSCCVIRNDGTKQRQRSRFGRPLLSRSPLLLDREPQEGWRRAGVSCGIVSITY